MENTRKQPGGPVGHMTLLENLDSTDPRIQYTCLPRERVRAEIRE